MKTKILMGSIGLVSLIIACTPEEIQKPEVALSQQRVLKLNNANDAWTSTNADVSVFNKQYLVVESGANVVLTNGSETRHFNFEQNQTSCTPAGVVDAFKVKNNTVNVLDVLKNDSPCDFKIDTSSLKIEFVPFFGSAYTKNGKVIYTTPNNHSGVDRFSYRVKVKNGTVEATMYGLVNLTIGEVYSNCQIRLFDDNYTMARKDLNMKDSAFVSPLLNDVLCLGDPSIQATIKVAPTKGTAAFNSKNVLCYKPNAGFAGTDVLVYERCELGLCKSAKVTMVVKAPAVACSSAAKADEFSSNSRLNKGTIKMIVLANDKICSSGIASVTITKAPANGQASMLSPSGLTTYTPNTGYKGTDTFEYTIKDKTGTTSTAVVTIKNI